MQPIQVLVHTPLYYKKLSCGWDAARTLVYVVFPTLRPASRDLLAEFSDICLPLSYLTPSMREIPSSYRIRMWYVKTRMAGLESVEGRMMVGRRIRDRKVAGSTTGLCATT